MQLLVYVGHTSPECQLHPGDALNAMFHAPAELSETSQQEALASMAAERQTEVTYAEQHDGDDE